MITPSTAAATPARSPKAAVITAAVEVIGPKEARYLLRLNTHNRHISLSAVTTMARDMAAGLWALNGETIKVSKTGKLIDGQHRLLAVIESGRPVAMMVVRGLDDEAQETVDGGRKRSLADVLGLDGEINANNLGAAIRFAWYLERFQKPKAFGINPSRSELREYLEENHDIRTSVTVGQRAAKTAIRYVPSIGSALHYLMGKLGDTGAANQFWEHLIDGDHGPGSPIYALREALIRDLSMPHRMSVEHRAALTIKGWNYWREGRTVKAIGWRSSGRAAEPFPVISRKPESIEENA